MGSSPVKSLAYLTTSWDDGHPLDLRVADLLTKYGLRGTFYAPMRAHNRTMTAAQIHELGCCFEIGAHTLDHIVLTHADEYQAEKQIEGSKSWVEDSTGLPCLMFCPPEGKYSGRHLRMMQEAGYIGFRSVELASLDYPRPRAGLMLMPTSVQAYPHRAVVFCKNAIKRAAFGNLWRYILHGRSTGWADLAGSLLRCVIEDGGVFHLWGHSWELQQTGQWQRLDEALQMMSELARYGSPLTNGQICRQFRVALTSARDVG
jgi:peptidoglycan/xylan/chitin deacetylase (PgdA/CDA1 family)